MNIFMFAKLRLQRAPILAPLPIANEYQIPATTGKSLKNHATIVFRLNTAHRDCIVVILYSIALKHFQLRFHRDIAPDMVSTVCNQFSHAMICLPHIVLYPFVVGNHHIGQPHCHSLALTQHPPSHLAPFSTTMFKSVDVHYQLLAAQQPENRKEQASRHPENHDGIISAYRPHQSHHVVWDALNTICMQRDMLQRRVFIFGKPFGIVLPAAKNGIMDITRTVVAYDILHKRLKTAILRRHTLYAHDSNLFHKKLSGIFVVDSVKKYVLQVSGCE